MRPASFVFVIACCSLTSWSTSSRAAFTPAACMQPNGTDGLPKALTAPTLIGQKTLAPGASFTAGPLKISIKKGVMPAYVGATQGEAVVDGEVVIVEARAKDGESSKNTASLHLPATIRLDRYRVIFEEAGATGGASFVVRAEDLGCAGELEATPLQKGEVVTTWLSTDGVSSVELFSGDDRETSVFSGDVFQLAVRSGLNENSRRRVVLDDQGKPLTPTWITLGGYERNDGANEAKELNVIALNTKGAQLKMAAHKIDVLKVVHGPKTKLRFKEAYAPAEPVVSVLVRVTRTK